ncbi:MAG: dipeptidyl-peptidase 3 family protein [Isosphaeraceae bacterium]
MRNSMPLALSFVLGCVSNVLGQGGDVKPLPLPKTIRVQSAAPRGEVWAELAPNEKMLAYHLIQAANAGRELLFQRTHRHSLAIKNVLEESLSQGRIQQTKSQLGEKAFQEFVVYGAKFLDQGGPYTASNRKYVLEQVTQSQVQGLIEGTSKASSLSKRDRAEIARLLCDPQFEVQQAPESPDGKGLELTGSNFYEKGITGPEVMAVLDRTLKPNINSRVIRSDQGLACETLTTQSPRVVGAALQQVVGHLQAARPFALSAHQKEQIEAMVKYFRGGDVEDFRQASISWVRDRAGSRVDFMIGWVEFEGDFLSRMAAWESYVQIVDPEISRLAQTLAHRAQEFEDAMPYGRFKKKFPADYSPPALMVTYFQEISGFRSGGYNLPNFDDIRRDVGAKNIIRLPMPGEDSDPTLKAMRREALQEFLPAGKVDPVLANRERCYRNLVLMHEIIGHGSGTYDTSKYGKTDDPVSVLGRLGSALEEQRADLTALVFVDDPKLVEIGACKDAPEAKRFRQLTYDIYLGEFLQRLSRDRTLTEMHQRGHWLFINKLLSAGAIRWAARDGGPMTVENQVLEVVDYNQFQSVARAVLGELQAIKANREEHQLKALFSEYAPLSAIEQPWAQAVIHRGQRLAINAGYVEQPWRVTAEGKYEMLGGSTLESIAPFWKP